ncbi:MAG: MCE family protein [Syntrophaceae bacterium]|nr:MCE family protein [Syntrophaceae bacterium]
MAAKNSKFFIGLFVVTGLLICAILIIWAGASGLFTKGSLYAAYFDESVQGLQVDSAVKYRGVEIGKVQSIAVAPDHRLIEVVMKISLSDDLQKQTVAALTTTGITGIVYVELAPIKPGELYDSPKITFKSGYPVIPSRRSGIGRFIADTGIIIQNIKEIDFKGISNQLKNTTRAIEDFMEGKQVDNIVTNLESASINLDRTIAQLNKTVAEGKVEEAVNEMMGILSDARNLIGHAKNEIDAFNLKEKSSRTDILLDDIDKKTKSIAAELQDTSENLRVTSENLQKFSESLKKDPSELIFSKPAPPRKAME